MQTSSDHILFRDEITGREVLFENPSATLVAHTPDELDQLISEAERQHKEGQWLAGYFSYEAGMHFEEKLKPLLPEKRNVPLARIGVFECPSDNKLPDKPGNLEKAFFSEPIPDWEFQAYEKKFDQLTHHMMMGDCYQGNLTFKMNCQWEGSPLELFNRLKEIQPVGHAALVNLGGPVILSRSPELFFKVDGEGWIESRPMKGTAPRGKTTSEDEEIKETLRNDPKNLSENVMIVDLLRNDISRISKAGSVHVPELYELQTYATVHQLISRVRGKLKPKTTLADILCALFPCGSVTGVPKIRAMEILSDLESGPRDVYCGAIGWIEPSGQMQFNVPIRTITLYENGQARFNVGGGVTLGSTAKSEYEECLVKAKFIKKLIENSR